MLKFKLFVISAIIDNMVRNGQMCHSLAIKLTEHNLNGGFSTAESIDSAYQKLTVFGFRKRVFALETIVGAPHLSTNSSSGTNVRYDLTKDEQTILNKGGPLFESLLDLKLINTLLL